VDKAARLNPTVVLMDIRMPELDGLQGAPGCRGAPDWLIALRASGTRLPRHF
jgi:CheY-like chemotaxis protein